LLPAVSFFQQQRVIEQAELYTIPEGLGWNLESGFECPVICSPEELEGNMRRIDYII
jgi:hypothetical protein